MDTSILTVSALSQAIKNSLEQSFPSVCVQGEISNCKLHSSGHLYFSIKDANAQIGAVMFRPDAALLKVLPKDGSQVIATGSINVYPASGKYQILVRELRPVGVGELLIKLEELKMKILKLGWFRKEHKKPLPKFPKRIGVVTSPTGAVIQDILNILNRRFSGFHLILYPVRVQGEGAAQEIAHAIDQMNHYDLVDVMIVGRGGGSIEDLWAFNEEIVAKAIFESRIPIIAAVGHETDHCIADYVADVRASTPSEAAEMVIAEKSQQFEYLTQMQRRMQQCVMQLIRQDKVRLQMIIRHPIMKTPYGILGQWSQRLDSIGQELNTKALHFLSTQRLLLEGKKQQLYSLQPSTKLNHYKQHLAGLNREITGAIGRKLQLTRNTLLQFNNSLDQLWKSKQTQRLSMFQAMQKQKQLEDLWRRVCDKKKEGLANLKLSLDLLNPKNVLTKGYCILFSKKDHSVITSVNAVEKKQQAEILLSDGKLLTTIDEILPK